MADADMFEGLVEVCLESGVELLDDDRFARMFGDLPADRPAHGEEPTP